MQDINATIIINLKNKTEEDLLRNVDYSRKKNIKNFPKSGLSFDETSSDEDVDLGYKIHSKVLTEGGTIPDDYLKWKEMVNPKKNKFFIIKYKNKKIGCFGVKELTRRIYGEDSDEKGIRPVVFANDKEYNQHRPNDFMYWSAILYGLKNGYSFIDLGGYQINPRGHLKGVNHFKRTWGGKIYYYNLDYPFHKAIGRKLIRNNALFWWMNKKFRSMYATTRNRTSIASM